MNDLAVIRASNSEAYAIVDPGDLTELGTYTWIANDKGRLWTDTFKGPVFLHRAIVQCPGGKYVRWLNGERRDCRRANLQVVNTREEVNAPPQPPRYPPGTTPPASVKKKRAKLRPGFEPPTIP